MDNGDYEDTERFNFQSNGKLRKADPGKTKTWYSNGQYYAFNEDGVLQTEWYNVKDVVDATRAEEWKIATSAEDAGYAGEYPAAGTGWVYSLDPEEDDYHWYYLVTINDGKNVTRNVPFNLLANDTKYRAKQIKGKTYLFDDKGIMKTGLVDLSENNAKGLEVQTASDKAGGAISRKMEPGIYYFRKDGATTAGQMVTGKTAVTEDSETFYYYFDSNDGGKALVNTVKDGIVYGPDGKRMDADDGNSNQIKTLTAALKYKKVKVGEDYEWITIPAGTDIIVTSSGKLRTSGTVKIEGDKWTVKMTLPDKGESGAADYDLIYDDPYATN